MIYQKRKNIRWKFFSIKPFKWFVENYLFISLIILGLVFNLSFMKRQASAAPGATDFVRQVRVLEIDRAGLRNPAGLAFSSRANAFQVMEAHGQGQPAPGQTDFIKLTPFSHPAGSARIAAAVQDPVNLALDNKAHRLLILHASANQLLEVREDPDGNLDAATLTRYDARGFGLQDPQGLTVDPGSGTLFILDAVGPQLVRIIPGSDGSFNNASISAISLLSSGVTDVRGLAFDSASGHLYVVSPVEQMLYELTQTGEVLTSRDLSPFHLGNPQGMLFAPTSDQTDAASKTSLFLADQGNTTTQSSGQIVEFSLTAATASATASFTSSLVKTTDMAAASFSPPSPDPSGLTYLPNTNTLLMSDGEVDETVSGITHFQGANVWEMTLGGSVVRTANISKVAPTVVPMTNEPTGVTWNPATGHYFVTDDDAQRVYDLNPGGDRLIGTADDTWTFFSTVANGNNNGDPEGIAFDTWNNHVFVSDGVNMEVYEYTTTGTLVNHFDVEAYGVLDNESVEFNPDSGTLLVLSNHGSPIIVETTISGGLLRTQDFSAANAIAPAGLAYAPASDGSGVKRFYIVDRGIDNNPNPNIIDGKMYELTAPSPLPPGFNTPPSVNAGPDQAVVLPGNAILDGTVTDDGLPNPPGTVTTTWSQESGPGLVTFGDTHAVDTTASFTLSGTYILRLTASDGELTGIDELTFTVTGTGSVTDVDVRVAASSDDAEEKVSGSMTLASLDLDLMIDTGSTPTQTNHAIGLRFNGISIPQGATIVNAYLQFEVDELNSEATQLIIQGQAADNALTFASTNSNIWSRARTAAAITWSPDPWLIVGQTGSAQRTPNLVAVIQEIVNRPGWVSSNSLVLIITGTGQRVAKSYEATPIGTAAPLLHVEYNTTPPPTNTPTATATNTPLPTDTPTATPTFTPTATNTPLPTDTPTSTPTFTPTATNTPLPTDTPTSTPTNTPLPTDTPTATPTDTPAPTNTPTATPTHTATNTPILTDTPTATPTDTPTATNTLVPTNTPTATPTFTPTATNTPLPDVIFADSFESGNLLPAWSSATTDGGDLSVSAAAALVGTQGMQALINDNHAIYVTDDRPTAESRYRARFYFDPNAIPMAKNNTLFIFHGLNAAGTVVMQVELRFSNNQYQIRAGLLNDSTSFTSTAWFTISDAPHPIELDWRASTAAAANNGGLTLWIDGVQKADLTGVDNDTRRIDSVRLGAVAGINNGTRGTYYVDAFESHRQTYIGP